MEHAAEHNNPEAIDLCGDHYRIKGQDILNAPDEVQDRKALCAAPSPASPSTVQEQAKLWLNMLRRNLVIGYIFTPFVHQACPMAACFCRRDRSAPVMNTAGGRPIR
uniref:Uncharacterized protein n=1 Tax=Arundo donax TaxID=35708 RepID=A0A0A9C7J5_ARUDO